MATLTPLTCDALLLLPSRLKDKKDLVESFIREQKAHAKTYAAEGLHSFAISDPERIRDDAGDCGFGTPVLKPRVAIPEPAPVTDVMKDVTNTTGQSPRATHRAKPPAEKKIAKEKNCHRTPPARIVRSSARKRTVSSEHDMEHSARLTERRERKRAKLAIMKPIESKNKGSAERDESASCNDTSNVKAKGKRRQHKKTRTPAGFALMHGFTATNVGKNRLTVHPPSFGMFGRGKASANVRVTRKKPLRQKGKQQFIFSELEFLGQSRIKQRSRLTHKTSSRSSASGSTSSAGSVHSKVQVKHVVTSKSSSDNRKLEPVAELEDQCNASDNSGHASTGTELTQVFSWSESERGDEIPQDAAPKSVSPATKEGTVMLDTRQMGWPSLKANAPTISSDPKRGTIQSPDDAAFALGHACEFGDLHSNAPTLGPSDSASRCPPCDPLLTKPSKTVSRYFSAHLPSNTAELTVTHNNYRDKPGAVIDVPRATQENKSPGELLLSVPWDATGHAELFSSQAGPTPVPEALITETGDALALSRTGGSSWTRQEHPSSPNSLDQALKVYEADYRDSFSVFKFPLEHMTATTIEPQMLHREPFVPTTADSPIHQQMAESRISDSCLSFRYSRGADFHCGSPRSFHWDYANDHTTTNRMVDDENIMSMCSAHASDPFNEEADLVNGFDAHGPSICDIDRYGFHENFKDREFHVSGDDETNMLMETEDCPETEYTLENIPQALDHIGTRGYDGSAFQQHSSTSSDMDDSDIIGDTEPFSQGRALLLGLPSETLTTRASRAFDAISHAEVRVAKTLRGHWRPLKF